LGLLISGCATGIKVITLKGDVRAFDRATGVECLDVIKSWDGYNWAISFGPPCYTTIKYKGKRIPDRR